jgi:glycosyltransferase involved in cell wall biosynthesis
LQIGLTLRAFTFFIDSTQYSGNSRQLLACVAELREMNYIVAVGVLGRESPWSSLLADAGAKVEHFDSKGLWDIKALFKLRAWLQQMPSDFMHVISLKALDAVGLSSPSLLSKSYLSGLPKVGFRPNLLRQRLLSKVRKIFCTTKASLNRLQTLGIPASKVAHLPLGISLLTTPQSPAPASETPYLFSSGPFHHDFNHRDALWSMDILHYVKPEIKLCLTGTGDNLQSLHSFRSALMTKDKIHFRGQVDFQEPWLAKASIILVTNLTPGGYYCAVEAMLSGRPLIASKTPGMAEFVEDEKTAVLYAPGECAELAKRIRLLLDDPTRASDIAHNARESAEFKFSPKLHIAKLLQYYDDFK